MLLKNHHKSPEDFSDRQERIYNFLRSCPIGVLSTVTPNGEPHGAVIYFTVDKEFNVSFVTKSETHKYENIKHSNQVTLTVYEPSTQTSAQIIGKATEITDNYEVNQVAGAIMATSMKTSEGGLPPISKLSAGEFVGFKIELNQIRMAVYANPDPGDYSELFETIESFELKDS